MTQGTPSSPAAPQDGADAEDRARTPIPSRALLGGRRRVLIEHEGEVYTLQVTRQGKLLLTK